MKQCPLLCGLCLLLVLALEPCNAEYYYSSGEQVPLRIDTLKITVRFADAGASAQASLMHPRLIEVLEDDLMPDGFDAIAIAPGGDIYSFLDTLNSTPGIVAAEPYYYVSDTIPTPVGDRLLVGFDPSLTADSVAALVQSYGLSIVHEVEDTPNVYLLHHDNPQEIRLLDVANSLYTADGVEYSHPEFSLRVNFYGYKLYDKYHVYQSHIKRTIGAFNTATVWDFAGVDDTIIVAVIDKGVTSHEDLPATRILPGIDYGPYSGFDNDPSPGTYEDHGMACAGLIGASHTTDSMAGSDASSGVISMKSQIKILPIKASDDQGRTGGVTMEEWGLAFKYAQTHGADVISCSWGYGSVPPPGYDYVERAINFAVLDGRNGKGCVVVFAAGNSNRGTFDYPSSKANVIRVGALDAFDYRWDYSSYGTTLDIMAPSGDLCLQGDLWTIDQMGNAGFNPFVDQVCTSPVIWNCSSPNDVDYDCHFGGTSGACPIVAGAAALVLAKDPTLTAAAVRDILQQSADTTLAWGVVPRFSEQYGYGRVDAFTAVLSLSHGDVNNDGYVADISDLSALIAYLNNPAQKPFPSVRLGDWNCSGGAVDLTDLSLCIAWVTGQQGRVLPVKPCFKY